MFTPVQEIFLKTNVALWEVLIITVESQNNLRWESSWTTSFSQTSQNPIAYAMRTNTPSGVAN